MSFFYLFRAIGGFKVDGTDGETSSFIILFVYPVVGVAPNSYFTYVVTSFVGTEVFRIIRTPVPLIYRRVKPVISRALHILNILEGFCHLSSSIGGDVHISCYYSL